MRTQFAGAALAAVFLSTGIAWAGQPAKEPPEKVRKAREKLDEKLAKLNAKQGQVLWIESAALARALPHETFFALRFRQFPVARATPPGLTPSNIFAVSDAGKARRLGGTAELLKFFQKHAAPVTDDKEAKKAVVAWLKLSQEFHQDGFFQFEILKKEIDVVKAGPVLRASGRAMVTRGGNGELRVTLDFGRGGKLAEAREEAKIRPGPRPICQATKLLDRDPIVRRMAEQDLLIMGRAAADYLREQRSRAAPELRRAIDRLWQRIQQQDR